jgi:hypothetical protein
MSTEVMPLWIGGLLATLTGVAAWMVRKAWRMGQRERAKLGPQPAVEYWWPKATLERSARLYGMVIMLLTAGFVTAGQAWAIWVGAAVMVISWGLNVLADYTDEYIAQRTPKLASRTNDNNTPVTP